MTTDKDKDAQINSLTEKVKELEAKCDDWQDDYIKQTKELEEKEKEIEELKERLGLATYATGESYEKCLKDELVKDLQSQLEAKERECEKWMEKALYLENTTEQDRIAGVVSLNKQLEDKIKKYREALEKIRDMAISDNGQATLSCWYIAKQALKD